MSSTDTEILYENTRPGVLRRVLVSAGTGTAFWAMTVFFHWGLHPSTIEGRWAPRIIGGVVSTAMLLWAVRSRVVFCVAMDPRGRTVRFHWDRGVIVVPFADIRSVTAESPGGGWSTQPADRLAVTLRDGNTQWYDLPDDADTPGIARDITLAVLSSPPAL